MSRVSWVKLPDPCQFLYPDLYFLQFLKGGVKVPTGGKARERPANIGVSRSGVTPEPTVKVWMKENMAICLLRTDLALCPYISFEGHDE